MPSLYCLRLDTFLVAFKPWNLFHRYNRYDSFSCCRYSSHTLKFIRVICLYTYSIYFSELVIVVYIVLDSVLFVVGSLLCIIHCLSGIPLTMLHIIVMISCGTASLASYNPNEMYTLTVILMIIKIRTSLLTLVELDAFPFKLPI